MNARKAMRMTIERAREANMTRRGPLSYAHIAWMLERMEEEDFSYGKLCRWLGWAQCAVVAAGCATLEEMKAINLLCRDNPGDES